MNATLTLNHKDQLALFYSEPLGIFPEWASVDVEMREIYLGGKEIEQKALKLDKIHPEIYERVQKEEKILLVRTAKTEKREPLEAMWVPLMVAQQM